jgi:hypothetical protein
MKPVALWRSAIQAAKTTGGVSQAKTRTADIRRILSEDWAVVLNASAHRNDATKRFHRYASAHREPIAVQNIRHIPRLSFWICRARGRPRGTPIANFSGSILNPDS